MSFPREQSSASVGSPGKHRVEVSGTRGLSLPKAPYGPQPARLNRAQSTKEEASKSR
jgi:hypothetical protein